LTNPEEKGWRYEKKKIGEKWEDTVFMFDGKKKTQIHHYQEGDERKARLKKKKGGSPV